MRFRARKICLYLENESEKKSRKELCLKRRSVWNKETRAQVNQKKGLLAFEMRKVTDGCLR